MAHTLYENEVLANKIEDILITSLDVNNYMTIDNTLATDAGMKKVVNVYTAEGEVEDLEMGEGNTKEISVSFEPVEYTVGTTQGRYSYFDEEAMTDPMVVEVGAKGLAQTMTNDLTTKAIAEFGKADLLTMDFPTGGIDFDTVVDAIGKYPYESEEGLFLLVSKDDVPGIRKNLADELKYVEGYVRTGYIGTICGVPVISTKAIETGTAFLATKAAVTCFIKKGSEAEQERDANTRKNTVYGRKVALVALTDKTRVVKIGG